jgi:hypothetical protein
MALLRPRLNDYFGLPFTQEEVDFAIPFLDEDLPLYVDPFLLWKSPSLQDNSLHTAVINSFNYINYLIIKGDENKAKEYLIIASECNEVGLGLSRSRVGKRIGATTANLIIEICKTTPQIRKGGFVHFEEIQLLVDNIAEDRISDFTCTYLKSFLIDYTIEQSKIHNIPLENINIENVYDYRKNLFITETVTLPSNPVTGIPVLFIPKRWLRFTPWINYDDYFSKYLITKLSQEQLDLLPDRISVLNFNRQNYDMVVTYVKEKERIQADCKNDPLFRAIPIQSAKNKFATIQSIKPGKVDNADKKYEDSICQLMASLLYPHLDFANEQSRTDSGVQIRDLVFYNNRSIDFLKDIYDVYETRQIVFEIKNMKIIETENINQLNRYLNEQFGRFGIIVTRNPPPRHVYKNTIDLWSGQRKCIIILTDEEIKLMVSVFESKQRLPIEVIKRSYIEFMRSCPG